MDQTLLNKLILSAGENGGKSFKLKEKGLKVDKRLSEFIQKYEKLRNIVGFHDEHAWRRYAIGRIIKRRIFLSAKDTSPAEDLLKELVLALYIKEEQVTPQAIEQIDSVIEKYLSALDLVKIEENVSDKDAQDWFFGLMAVEIEDILGLLEHQVTLIEVMQDEMFQGLVFPKYHLDDEQKKVLILIGSARALFKADDRLIAYLLIKKYHPNWLGGGSESKQLLAIDIWHLKQQIKQYESHFLFKQLLRVLKKHVVIFWVLDDVIKKYKGDLRDLKVKTYAVIKEVYLKLQKKVYRQVWHSFLYLLVVKFSLVVILEMPYDIWFAAGKVDYRQVAINVGSPLFLLLILTIGIRVGNRANTKLILKEVERLVVGERVGDVEEDKNALEVRIERDIVMPEQRSIARLMFFNLLFIIAYLFSYGTIIYFLLRMHFSLVSGFLFVSFITIVTYLAIRIRYTAERYRILSLSDGVGREMLYFFALPVLRTGQWLAGQFSKYNIVLLIFDLLFEAPYKTLVFLFRDFSDFAREKREIE